MRIATGAAVTHADIEIAVGTELKRSTIVVGEGLIDRKNGKAIRQSLVGILTDVVTGDYGITVKVSIINIEIIFGVAKARRKSQAKEAALPAAADAIGNI